jgi:hypothetical protein
LTFTLTAPVYNRDGDLDDCPPILTLGDVYKSSTSACTVTQTTISNSSLISFTCDEGTNLKENPITFETIGFTIDA